MCEFYYLIYKSRRSYVDFDQLILGHNVHSKKRQSPRLILFLLYFHFLFHSLLLFFFFLLLPFFILLFLLIFFPSSSSSIFASPSLGRSKVRVHSELCINPRMVLTSSVMLITNKQWLIASDWRWSARNTARMQRWEDPTSFLFRRKPRLLLMLACIGCAFLSADRIRCHLWVPAHEGRVSRDGNLLSGAQTPLPEAFPALGTNPQSPHRCGGRTTGEFHSCCALHMRCRLW